VFERVVNADWCGCYLHKLFAKKTCSLLMKASSLYWHTWRRQH